MARRTLRIVGLVVGCAAGGALGSCSEIVGIEPFSVAGEIIEGGAADVSTSSCAGEGQALYDGGVDDEVDDDADLDVGPAASAPQSASCAPGGDGLTNCGTDHESCCASLFVEGGTFFRTYDPLDDAEIPEVSGEGGPTGEKAPATVSAFRLDKYEVTVGRFRQYVDYLNDGGLPPQPGSGKHTHLNGGSGLANGVSQLPGDGPVSYETGWLSSDDINISPTNANLSCPQTAYDTWTAFPAGQENLPITCVNWYESYAFCIWDGGFLPSEAELEYAGAGGNQQREYPWGSMAPGTGNNYAIYGCLYGAGGCSGVDNVAPVGTAMSGTGLWGQLDLAGNVNEWALDYMSSTYTDPCIDCAYFTDTSYRVIRGGNFSYGQDMLLVSFIQSPAVSAVRNAGLGIRCARSP